MIHKNNESPLLLIFTSRWKPQNQIQTVNSATLRMKENTSVNQPDEKQTADVSIHLWREVSRRCWRHLWGAARTHARTHAR